MPTQYLYLPSALFAILCALLFDQLLTSRSGNLHRLVAASVLLGFVVLANGWGLGNAAAEWTAVVRRTRQPYRDTLASHPTLPQDTLLYFVDAPSLRDLKGVFHLREGGNVTVEGTPDSYQLNSVPYPTIWNANPKQVQGVEPARMVGLRNHAVAWVYYFDSAGKMSEVVVNKDAATTASLILPITFGGAINLEGYQIANNSLKTGDNLVLLLYWCALDRVVRDYTVFVHLVDTNGNMVGGYDSFPVGGRAPTSSWKPGALVADSIIMPIPADIPNGSDYQLQVGLYYLPTMERLLIAGGEQPATGDHITLSPFSIY